MDTKTGTLTNDQLTPVVRTGFEAGSTQYPGKTWEQLEPSARNQIIDKAGREVLNIHSDFAAGKSNR